MESKGKKYRVESKSILMSFKRALDGVKHAYSTEFHMVVHGYVAAGVVIAGALFQISYVEWLVCLLLIGAVFALELINTSIESIVNMITTDYNFHAKVAKDTAAGAVLVMSIVSAVIGLIIFVPKFFELF